MSKIYNKYLELKSKKDNKILYLFKSGIFFIFIDDDAKIISQHLNLKLGKLNDKIVKCGFPINSLEKYMNVLKDIPYKIEIVNLSCSKTLSAFDYCYYENIKNIVNELITVNIDSLSISEAYDFLYKMKNKLVVINRDYINEKNEQSL